jgi:hypothetical protein
MTRSTEKISLPLAHEIRRPFEDGQLERYIRSLPAFRPEPRIPARFVELLGRIDEAERQSRSRRRG